MEEGRVGITEMKGDGFGDGKEAEVRVCQAQDDWVVVVVVIRREQICNAAEAERLGGRQDLLWPGLARG